MIVLVLISVFVLLLSVWWSRVLQKNGTGCPLPPGPRGLPVLGSLLSLDPINPHKSLTKLADRYANNGMFSVQLGSVFTVVMTDPIMIKEAFNKEIFTVRPSLYLTMDLLEGKGLITSSGDLWRDQRKLLSTWMRTLGAGRGSLARPHLAARLTVAADRLEMEIAKNLDSFDIFHGMVSVMGNTINELMYGISYPENDPIWKWMLEIQEQGVKEMGVAGVLNFLPFLRFVSTKLRRTMKNITIGQKQTHQVIKKIVKIRRKLIAKKFGLVFDEGDADDEEMEFKLVSLYSDNATVCKFNPKTLTILEDDCIIDYYLVEQEKRKLEGDIAGFERMCDENMGFFMCDIFGAALDTTMNTLGWFMLMMATHPEEQVKVRKELHGVYGETPPTLDCMMDLIYTRAAISETQRIRSVVPLGLPHGISEDTVFGGYFIPKGSMILPFQWYIHNDPSVWKNPDDFNPSRFIGPDQKLLNIPNFIPFQNGKRMCPGDEFAKMIIFMFGSRIISRYEIELEKPIPSTDGVFGLTLNPPPYRLKLKPLFG